MLASVDKMQGQERPIPIISMCTSDVEAFQRGLEFLLDLNRLNLAITRARGLAIIVCSKKLGWVKLVSLETMGFMNFWIGFAFSMLNCMALMGFIVER